jgi:hypothetical protein
MNVDTNRITKILTSGELSIQLRLDHIENPIQASIALVCEKYNIPIYDLSEIPKEDHVIVYHNKVPTLTGKNIYWWMCDLRPPTALQGNNTFKHIFLCNKEYLDAYSSHFDAPTSYLPQCGDDREGQTIRDVAEGVFIGSLGPNQWHQNRGHIIQEFQMWCELDLVTGEGYSIDTKGLYKNAKFSLAISPQADGYTSNRLYNILSSKGFCLTLWFPGIEELFVNHKHLVWFKDISELKEIIDYYREHEDERQAICEDGYKIYKNNHTAEHRLKTICQTLLLDLDK